MVAIKINQDSNTNPFDQPPIIKVDQPKSSKKDISHLIPNQPIKQEDISYTQVNNSNTAVFGFFKLNFANREFVQQWAANQTNEKLREVALNGIIKTVDGHEKSITSHPHLVVPSNKALEFRAQYYHDKYNIVIRTTELKDLGTLITHLQSEIKEPMYIGILVSKNSDATSHATPILCYFDGKEGQENQFLILESIGDNNYINPTLEHLHNSGVSKTAIKYSNKTRQADEHSCRTSSITLLRNALLSLRYHQHQNGFDEALKTGKLNAGQTINELPPDWDYTEQISNKIAPPNALVIRNYFSKKPEKQNKQETIGEHRQRYTENVTIQHRLWQNNSNYREEFAEAGVLPDQNYPVDQNTTVFTNRYMTEIKITQTKYVNVYLLKKGFSNQGKDIQVTIHSS